MNKNTILVNVGYWFLIGVVVATCLYLVIYLKGTGREGLADPLEFYAEKMETECFCIDDIMETPTYNNRISIPINFSLNSSS